MPVVHVERIGGLAGFGGSRAHVRSRGQLDTDGLSPADRHAVDAIFKLSADSAKPDEFRYRISRGSETVEVPESAVPAALVRCVADELV